MKVQVQKLFEPGMEIPYEYDFGTTSELVIKVVGERQGKPTTKNPIVLMARNNSSRRPAPSAASRPTGVRRVRMGGRVHRACSAKRMPTNTSTKTC